MSAVLQLEATRPNIRFRH